MAREAPTKVYEKAQGKWFFVGWSDGTEQWSVYRLEVKAVLYVERVVSKTSRRKRWCVVDRRGDWMAMLPKTRQFNTQLYPPKVAGPFADLEGAKAALLILLSTGDHS